MPQVMFNNFLVSSWQAVLAALYGSTPAHPLVKLIAQDFTPVPSLDVSALPEPVFTGYAAFSVTAFLAAHLDGPGVACSNASAVVSFGCTSAPLTPVMVWGYWVADSNGDLAFSERFASPFTFAIAGDTLSFALPFCIGSAGLTAQILP